MDAEAIMSYRAEPRAAAIALSFLFAHSVLTSSAAHGAAAQQIIVSDGQSISRDFKSWSLFLVCNAEWLVSTDVAQSNMTDLYQAFGRFGEIIGREHLAVWFSRPGTPGNPAAPQAYDSAEAADYCAHYGLSANDSPHIVVTTTYPTKDGERGNYYAMSLNGFDNQNRLRLLNTIRDRIVTSDFSAARFDSDVYWRGWIQILQDSAQALGQLVPGFKVTVDTELVKVEFDGSKISR
jgi:hypothetical protein